MSSAIPTSAAPSIDPLQHFIRHGMPERRDPNRFFDSAWYCRTLPRRGGQRPASAAALSAVRRGGTAQSASAVRRRLVCRPASRRRRQPAAVPYQHRRSARLPDRKASRHRRLPALRAAALPVPADRPRRCCHPGLSRPRGNPRCIQSVLADPATPLGQVIVVDDRSPEPSSVAWLDKLAAAGRIQLMRNRAQPRVCQLRQRRHGGRRRPRRRAAEQRHGGAAGWLRRLAAQAYAESSDRHRVAVLQQRDDLRLSGQRWRPHRLRRHAGRDRRRLPRGERRPLRGCPDNRRLLHVYPPRRRCTRSALFDAERFGLGYGEENDFCLRATALGWQHRIACDTFVYHKGSVSFGDRADALSKRAMALTAGTLPDYAARVARPRRARMRSARSGSPSPARCSARPACR